jgi:hypothetical protein
MNYEQRDIQVWNDAVAACEKAVWGEVEAFERKAADGRPHEARRIMRAVGNLHNGNDDRQKLPDTPEMREFMSKFPKYKSDPAPEMTPDQKRIARLEGALQFYAEHAWVREEYTGGFFGDPPIFKDNGMTARLALARKVVPHEV